MQKQQQESLRLREAERHRYGEARMQVCCQAIQLSFAPANLSSQTFLLNLYRL